MVDIYTHEELVDSALSILAWQRGINPNPRRGTWPYRWQSLMEKIIECNGDMTGFLHWPVVTDAFHSGYVQYSEHERSNIPDNLRALSTDPQFLSNAPGFPISPERASGTYVKQLFVAHKLGEAAGIYWSTNTMDVIEIGGGYGAMRVIMDRLRRFSPGEAIPYRHFVLDDPSTHLIRGWYLYNLDLYTVNRSPLYLTIGKEMINMFPYSVGPNPFAMLSMTQKDVYLTNQSILYPEIATDPSNTILIAVHSLDEIDPFHRLEILKSYPAAYYGIYMTRSYDSVDNDEFLHFNWIRPNNLTVLYGYTDPTGMQSFYVLRDPKYAG